MIHYHVSYNNPLSYFLQIEMRIPALQQPVLHLQLPAWRPGRYELQNFAQKIRKFEILDNDSQPVRFEKITKDRWLVQTENLQEITVRYDFYAHQMDAGGSWLDETQLYINPVNCFMTAAGFENESCELLLNIPENWQIACGLKAKNQNTLLAESFDELVDCPLFASGTLQHETYTVRGIPFHIWIQGNCKPDWPTLLADFRDFTEEQLALFHDFPVQDYHFMFQILPYKHYHGVEHSNSTVCVLGPADALMQRSTYKELLGVSCHELFHTWNIKKIRPAEMMPYDFTQENYFRTGFVAEGITTYYGDYLLGRSGVFSAAQYFDELNGVLKKHYDDYGRHNYSVADSSFDMWLDGYKPGIPDRKVSIYHKGALAALILDLELRRVTNNQYSLDDVMRHLWNEFGKRGIGYTEQDYISIVDQIGGISFEKYFKDIIYGTVSLESPLDNALRFVGCELREEQNPVSYERKFGFRAVMKKEWPNVSAIMPDAPAAFVFTTDDDIIAVNGRRVENNLNELFKDGESFEVAVFRNYQLRSVKLETTGRNFLNNYVVTKRPDATEAEKDNFQRWLNQQF
ncbi:M61 family metallopeptidase [Adhaeribacter terreus]|uniref:M61 family metallopeptidase n=1 Tax=Adhaeribacter terreus TaxID=529703 RepID=A0ABW0E9T1_9BACT